MRKIIEDLIQKTGSTSPENFCKFLGIKIWYTNMNYLGFILKINEEINIFVNSNLSIFSRDVVILHELGHYFFHPIDRFIAMRDHFLFQNNKIENEANKFAATAIKILNNEYELENDIDTNIFENISKF